MEAEDERRVELDSVEAIFPELVRHGPTSVSLEIAVSLNEPVKIALDSPRSPMQDQVSLHHSLFPNNIPRDAARSDIRHVWHLPPLQLSLHLPDNYPSAQPPIIKLDSQEGWVPKEKLVKLSSAALELWEAIGRDQVVYSYIEFLHDAAERGFDLATGGIMKARFDLQQRLLDFDADIKKEKFDTATFDCGICLEPKKGVDCHRLLRCGHVYCIGCLQSFYSSCITEGDVDGVKCLNPLCGKDAEKQVPITGRSKRHRRLHPSELLQIPIPADKVQRYIRLRKKQRLEADPSTIYCPRDWCQGPAREGHKPVLDEDFTSDSDEEVAKNGPLAALPQQNQAIDLSHDQGGEDAAIRRIKMRPPSECLAVCTECSFAFCVVCKHSWHGEFGFCSVRYDTIYSKEEKASEEYLQKYTTPCPTCNTRSQKSMGCNHMICRQCKTHFCYLCSSWLDSDNPYSHFNTFGKPCYQKLWELEAGDGESEQPAAGPAVENGHRQAQAAPGGRVQRRLHQGPARPDPIGPYVPGHEMQGHGLQRFLELAERDEEDGWDSDELEDQFVQFMLRDR